MSSPQSDNGLVWPCWEGSDQGLCNLLSSVYESGFLCKKRFFIPVSSGCGGFVRRWWCEPVTRGLGSWEWIYERILSRRVCSGPGPSCHWTRIIVRPGHALLCSTYIATWYGGVWYGGQGLWCGIVWYGKVWCGQGLWCGMVWCSMI